MAQFNDPMASFFDAMNSDQMQRNKSALELKILSRRMEMELANSKDINSWSKEGTATLQNAINIQYPQMGAKLPERASNSEASGYLGLIKAGVSASTRAGSGASVVDINALAPKILQNPELYDTLDARTKGRLLTHSLMKDFVYLGKPLSAERENLMAKSNASIGAIDRINKLLDSHPEDYAQYFAPGKLGARELNAEVTFLKELYEKIQTGAASNSREDITYRTLIAPNIVELLEDISDGQFDNSLMKHRLQIIREQLEPLTKNRPTAVVSGRESVANQFKAGNPVSGKTEKQELDSWLKAVDDAMSGAR